MLVESAGVGECCRVLLDINLDIGVAVSAATRLRQFSETPVNFRRVTNRRSGLYRSIIRSCQPQRVAAILFNKDDKYNG